MPDRLERLLNLTATLLDTRRPLTLEELAERVEPRYPDDKAARRRQFERDKETLRELGIPISVESADGLGAEQAYRIRPEEYYLPDFSLDAAELAALHLAVTAVRLEGGEAREALAKLGGVEGEGRQIALAELAVTPIVATLFDAVNRRASITFSYRDQTRHLEPYGVVMRWGHWYVVGHDVDRDAPRAFRVDRIVDDPVVGKPGSFEPASDVDPAKFVREDPMTYGEDHPVEARVLVDPSRAGWVVEQLGDGAVVGRHADGSVEVVLDVVNRSAFRTWVIDLLDHAEVLGPDELRADLVEWLRAIAAGGA